MSFAAPMMLWFALTGAAIVALYMLKSKRRRVTVSTLMFWEQVFEPTRPRSAWRRLRHLLSLLAQLCLLALLVIAMARPTLPWQAFEPRHVVLIIDNGASMTGRRAEGIRLDEAKRLARQAIDGLRYGDTMAILTAAVRPRVVCPMTDRQTALRDAIDAIKSTDAPARIAQTVAVAQRIVEGRPHARVIVIGDQPVDSADVLPVSGETDNLAITRFAVRRSLVDPVGYAVLIEVRNFGEAAATCRIELALAGETIDVFPMELDPGETWSHIFEKASPRGGQLIATIDRADALAADNTAAAILPARKPLRVRVAGESNLFVTRALEAIPTVELVDTDADVTVFYRDVPDALPPGDALVIDPARSTDAWTLDEPLQHPLIGRQDDNAPLMAHVELSDVLIPEARRIEPAGNAHILAETIDGSPMYFAVERASDRTLVLAADLDHSDLPLRTAFPIMLTNAINWFAGAGGELQASIATGETMRVDGRIAGPFAHVGIHAAGDAPIACNLVNEIESDLRVPDGFIDSGAALSAGFGGRPMWYYLLAAACGLMAIEWWLYQRRWLS